MRAAALLRLAASSLALAAPARAADTLGFSASVRLAGATPLIVARLDEAAAFPRLRELHAGGYVSPLVDQAWLRERPATAGLALLSGYLSHLAFGAFDHTPALRTLRLFAYLDWTGDGGELAFSCVLDRATYSRIAWRRYNDASFVDLCPGSVIPQHVAETLREESGR